MPHTMTMDDLWSLQFLTSVVLSPDGRRVAYTMMSRDKAKNETSTAVWRVLTKLTTFEAATCYLALLPDEQSLLVAQGRANHPWELYRLPIVERAIDEVGTQERLTHLYDDLMNELVLGKTERIQYAGANGEQVEGWLTLPPNARSGVRYPLLVMIHGGPHGAFGVGVEPIHQYCAARGYAVFYCNPHGSATYGEAFMRRVLGDWGGWDYEDIMRGVAVCIEIRPEEYE